MCEANAYLQDTEGEVLFMEAVDIIEPYEDGLKLVDIFGRQKFIRARIKDMTLLSHRIVLEVAEAGSGLRRGLSSETGVHVDQFEFSPGA